MSNLKDTGLWRGKWGDRSPELPGGGILPVFAGIAACRDVGPGAAGAFESAPRSASPSAAPAEAGMVTDEAAGVRMERCTRIARWKEISTKQPGKDCARAACVV